MPEYDDIAGAAASEATVPDLDALVDRGVRRRRTRRASLVGAAALAVVAAVGVTTLVGGDERNIQPTPPSPSRSGEPSADSSHPAGAATPEEVVGGADAVLMELALTPDRPEVRAAVWLSCRGCDDPRYAVAVTGDGFATRDLFPEVFAGHPLLEGGGGRFHLSAGSDDGGEGPGPGWVLEPGREPREVVEADGPAPGPGPVIQVSDEDGKWTGIVDLERATVHRVTGPDGVEDGLVVHELPAGAVGSRPALLAMRHGDRVTVHVSTDNGETWTRLDELPPALYGVIPRADGGRLTLVEGGDGATYLPFGALHVLGGGGFDRQSMNLDPMAYVGQQVVLAEGRLLSEIEAWSDEGVGGSEPGLYSSAGRDWTKLEQVTMGAPFDDRRTSLVLHEVVVHGETVTLVAAAPPGAPEDAYASTDGGRTWAPLPMR